MATTIFLVLNGLGVIFLLYVLANFWKEGQRGKNEESAGILEFRVRDWMEVVVATRPIGSRGAAKGSVIQFQDRNREARSGRADKVA